MFPGTSAVKFADPHCSALGKLKTAEKRQLSEQKRQASFDAKTQTAKIQRDVIAAALAEELRGEKKNKRIRFPSDSGDEGEVGSAATRPSGGSIAATQNKRKTGPKSLFEESDDEAEVADITESFRAAAQYRGSAGEKLRKLEAKFGGDKRFKMSANFLDDDYDDGEEEKSGDDGGTSAEKSQQLKILENIVGKPVDSALRRDDKEKKRKLFQTGASVRYDPAKAEHYRYKKETATRTNVEEEKRENCQRDSTQMTS